MKAKGYSDSSPLRAGTDVDTSAPKPSAREVAEAQADVGCKRKVDLVKIWSGYETGYQLAQIDKHIEELQRVKKQTEDQLIRAEAAIAGH
jgi:hypothetical protein